MIKKVIEIELSDLDLCYENCRIANAQVEKRILSSIVERGFDDPVRGVDQEGKYILLDGFKRVRCAKKLNMGKIPYLPIAKHEKIGIIDFLREDLKNRMNLFEHARWLKELKDTQGLSIKEMSVHLSRSSSWVGMRLNLFDGMNEDMSKLLFSGKFPVHVYQYTLRRFMRMDGVKIKDAESFMKSVSGKKLSNREVENLAWGYFKGPSEYREQIEKGKLEWTLEQIKHVDQYPQACNEHERKVLKSFLKLENLFLRISKEIESPHLKNREFFVQAQMFCEKITAYQNNFTPILRRFNDRCKHA